MPTVTGTIQLTSGYFGTSSNIIATPFTYDEETVTFDNLKNATVVFDVNGDFNQNTETLGVSVNGSSNGTFFNQSTGDEGDFSYVSGTSAAYNSSNDTLTTGWDYIEINGNRGYPGDDTAYTGSQYVPGDFDPVDSLDGTAIINNTATMGFDTESPQFEATFATLNSLTFDVDPTGSGEINFGVDAAEINYTVTFETELCTTWTVEGGGIVVEVEASNTEGGVEFCIDLVEGTADLNGLFVDLGNDGGDIDFVGSRSNNMKGSTEDGIKLDGFDEAVELGSVGGNDEDFTSGCVTINGLTLEELQGAEIGIRATSVGPDREDSLKLAALCEDEGGGSGGPDYFANLPQAISNIVVVTDPSDPSCDTTGFDQQPDGYYAVKVDNWSDVTQETDLDNFWSDIVAALETNDDCFNEADVVGVFIKSGSQAFDDFAGNPGVFDDTAFFALDDDTDPDPLPDSPPIQDPPIAGNEIETTFDFSELNLIA